MLISFIAMTDFAITKKLASVVRNKRKSTPENSADAPTETKTEEPTHPVTEEKSKKKMPIVSILIGVLLAGLLIAGALWVISNRDTDNDRTPIENKELIHISQIPICISGKYFTLEQIQDKARKEKEMLIGIL